MDSPNYIQLKQNSFNSPILPSVAQQLGVDVSGIADLYDNVFQVCFTYMNVMGKSEEEFHHWTLRVCITIGICYYAQSLELPKIMDYNIIKYVFLIDYFYTSLTSIYPELTPDDLSIVIPELFKAEMEWINIWTLTNNNPLTISLYQQNVLSIANVNNELTGWEEIKFNSPFTCIGLQFFTYPVASLDSLLLHVQSSTDYASFDILKNIRFKRIQPRALKVRHAYDSDSDDSEDETKHLWEGDSREAPPSPDKSKYFVDVIGIYSGQDFECPPNVEIIFTSPFGTAPSAPMDKKKLSKGQHVVTSSGSMGQKNIFTDGDVVPNFNLHYTDSNSGIQKEQVYQLVPITRKYSSLEEFIYSEVVPSGYPAIVYLEGIYTYESVVVGHVTGTSRLAPSKKELGVDIDSLAAALERIKSGEESKTAPVVESPLNLTVAAGGMSSKPKFRLPAGGMSSKTLPIGGIVDIPPAGRVSSKPKFAPLQREPPEEYDPFGGEVYSPHQREPSEEYDPFGGEVYIPPQREPSEEYDPLGGEVYTSPQRDQSVEYAPVGGEEGEEVEDRPPTPPPQKRRSTRGKPRKGGSKKHSKKHARKITNKKRKNKKTSKRKN